jgi:hypothetical protein
MDEFMIYILTFLLGGIIGSMISVFVFVLIELCNDTDE